MSTCDLARRALLFTVAAFTSFLAVGCGETGACVRYSDCSAGYTCAAGQCVFLQSSPPPADTDDADVSTTDADTDADTDAAASQDGSVPGDASVDGEAGAVTDGAPSDAAPAGDAASAARDAPAE